MPAETRVSIRQQIFDAIKARFATIRQINGFATEIGSHFFAWRDIEKVPFTTDELSGCFSIFDPEREPGDGVINVHDQVLTIEVVAAASPAGNIGSADNHARRIEADILAAIGIDRQWEINGIKLAKDTLPGKSLLGVGHLGDRVAWVKLTFTIRFRTQRFDPYTL